MKEFVYTSLKAIDGHLVKSDQEMALKGCRTLIDELEKASRVVPNRSNTKGYLDPQSETWRLMLSPIRKTARCTTNGDFRGARVSLQSAGRVFAAAMSKTEPRADSCQLPLLPE